MILKELFKEKYSETKEVVKKKTEDAKAFYRLHRSTVNASVAAFVGGVASSVFIVKKLSKKKDLDDMNEDAYYECNRIFNIDGKEIGGLFQYLGKRDGAAIWLDPEDEEFRSLNRHFRNDNENKY